MMKIVILIHIDEKWKHGCLAYSSMKKRYYWKRSR
jgi:hypothetical protein